MPNHICPVCEYGRLKYPPSDYTICPSCGTEFGLDDSGTTAEEVQAQQAKLRERWRENGKKWWSIHQQEEK